MLFDPMLKHHSKILALYQRIDSMSFDKISTKTKEAISMRIMCEFVSIMRNKHNVTEQALAEALNLPLFVVKEIEDNSFVMSKNSFDCIMQTIGEVRESGVLFRKLHRKLS